MRINYALSVKLQEQVLGLNGWDNLGVYVVQVRGCLSTSGVGLVQCTNRSTILTMAGASCSAMQYPSTHLNIVRNSVAEAFSVAQISGLLWWRPRLGSCC